MNRAFAFLAFVAVLVLGFSVAVAAEPPSNYEHLKALDRLVGTWDVVFKFDDGKTLPSRAVYEWGKDRNFMVVTWTIPGEKERSGVEVFAWDAARKEIRMWGFNFLMRTSAVWSMDGDTWKGTYSLTHTDGQKGKGAVTEKWAGTDLLKATFAFDAPAGEATSKGVAEMKRVK